MTFLRDTVSQSFTCQCGFIEQDAKAFRSHCTIVHPKLPSNNDRGTQLPIARIVSF